MSEERKKKLEMAGWKFGDYADFLGMAPEEKAVVEIRLASTRRPKRLRTQNSSFQAEQCPSFKLPL